MELQAKDKVNIAESMSKRLLGHTFNGKFYYYFPSQFLRKLNRQERVIEEVKLVLKPHYNKKHVTKDEYKDIMRKAVPKVSVILHLKLGGQRISFT